MTSFNLEQSARELTESIAKGPPLSSVSLAEARKAVEAAQFKDGPYGSADGLAWFWNSYLTAEGSRGDILVSPVQATLADLEGMPPALLIVDENDLLRDQGEAYADKLRDAGVPTTSVTSLLRRRSLA